MKIVILAGGRPSTISNEQEGIPKPMAEIGGKPLLWHIMKHFSECGFNEFIICGGYKVDIIKSYFMDYYIYESDITVDLQSNCVTIHKKRTEDWKVTVVDTGLDTSTAERVAKIKKYVGEETFVVTYGDCLTDVNVKEVICKHNGSGKLVTMVTARTAGRNETLTIGEDGQLLGPAVDSENNAWTNACMYVMSHKIFDLINERASLEEVLMRTLISQKEIIAYKHDGFWIPVETYRDLIQMENMWDKGITPWLKSIRTCDNGGYK